MKPLTALAICASLFGFTACESFPGTTRVPDRPLPHSSGAGTSVVDPAPPVGTQLPNPYAPTQTTAPMQPTSPQAGDPYAQPGPSVTPQPPVATAPRVPYGSPVPGRPGFIFSPYNNAELDVRGIKSGTAVRDPGDPNPAHKFLVP